jgi:hypothetical protein
VKRQLAVVTVDNDILGELCKMPHIFTNAEYSDMLYVYGICDGSAIAAVEKYTYRRRSPMSRILDRKVFSEVFNTVRDCGTFPSAHVASERARQQHVKQQENILEMVQLSPTASTRRFSTCLGVSRTRV